MDYKRIREIFDRAMDLPESQRSEFIARECCGNADCEAELRSLIANANSTMSTDPPDPPEDELIGKVVGERYLIKRQIGHGGMGAVYLALDQRVKNQKVVIKFLAKTLAANNLIRQRFELEVEALTRVNHRGVIRVTDSGQLDDGRPYFVMPHLKGHELRDRIGDQGTDPKSAGGILKQIGEALDAAHEVGVIHRDIKPENIMLVSRTDDVVLIDFGIAKLQYPDLDLLTEIGATPGTRSYMSPEQLSGKEITTASDIFSMGVVAYELVTGKRPFDRSTAKESEATPPSQLNRSLSARVDELILGALKSDPELRPRRAGELGHNLADALGRPVRAFSRVKLAICALVLLVIAASIYGVYKYRNRPDPGPYHRLSYSLTVQRMHNGTEYGPPGKSHGDDETFEKDDKFRVTISRTEPGYLYVFAESGQVSNDTNFRMIYPRTAVNNGSAGIGLDQTVETEWCFFRGPAGHENVWIVWSALPMTELEALKQGAFNHPEGGISNQELIAVRQFLQKMKDEAGAGVSHYDRDDTAMVRGKRDFLVTVAKLKHR